MVYTLLLVMAFVPLSPPLPAWPPPFFSCGLDGACTGLGIGLLGGLVEVSSALREVSQERRLT